MSSVSRPQRSSAVLQRDVVADRLVHLLACERRASRCASRSGRRRWPSARDCAISFSWCGKTRSSPPPWISNSGPRCFSDMAEHSMCQPGRPAPPRRLPRGVLARLVRLPEREVARILLARVRLLLLDLVEPLTAEAAVLRIARDAEVDVAVGLVREARARSAPRSSRSGRGPSRRRVGSTSGRPSPRPSVSSTYQRVASAASCALAPGAAS